jgi:hypothetical protein
VLSRPLNAYKFAKQIFISYSHIDNQPLPPEQQGWITRFHQTLQGLLNMRLGRDAAIWRDDKLSGNDVFADEIVQQFKDVALLISVLTPRYIKSEWCTREARLFCQEAEKNGGLVVENKSRLLKVVKTPFDTLDSLPDAFKSVLGYDFYALSMPWKRVSPWISIQSMAISSSKTTIERWHFLPTMPPHSSIRSKLRDPAHRRMPLSLKARRQQSIWPNAALTGGKTEKS